MMTLKILVVVSGILSAIHYAQGTSIRGGQDQRTRRNLQGGLGGFFGGQGGTGPSFGGHGAGGPPIMGNGTMMGGVPPFMGNGTMMGDVPPFGRGPPMMGGGGFFHMFDIPNMTTITCTSSTSQPACSFDRDGEEGTWVCRTAYSPWTGAAKSFSACIDASTSFPGDECGCCGGTCPDPCTCSCTTMDGQAGVLVNKTNDHFASPIEGT